jgi:hypothetical protein
MTQGRCRHRYIAFVVAAALHFLILWMLWMHEPIARRIGHHDPSIPSVLFFIDTPRPPVTTPSPDRAPRVETIADEFPAPSAAEETSAAPAPPTPPATIDWTAQASEAAAAVVDKAISEETRKCDPSDAPTSFLPPCSPKTRKFEWNPEPGRFGFSGGLPYVRVGERCAIGLGFFGCGFGARPPANGDLFEGMDDPERDRSSVPSADP